MAGLVPAIHASRRRNSQRRRSESPSTSEAGYAIRDLDLPMLLPGIKLNTSPTDHILGDQMQFMRFNGKSWERFGELQTGIEDSRGIGFG